MASVLEQTTDSDVLRLYALRHQTPMWTDAGVLGTDGREALDLLRASDDEGLTPSDYAVTQIDVRPGERAAPRDIAAFDVALSGTLLRYLHDLHVGRVDPRQLGFRLRLPPDAHDFVAVLHAARDGHRLKAAAAELRPALGQYDALRGALVRYRVLASDEPPALPVAKTGVHPGDPYAAFDVLSRRLVALGDMQLAAGPTNVGVYDAALVDAVIRFQRRHGLDADGVLGGRTLRELNVSFAWRARQLALALERLRWLPDVGEERLIAINIPMFRLWAWNANASRQAPALDMAVIVGRAARSETPIIDQPLRSVVFRPFWNVPRSILRDEILATLARDPAYLDRENMEIVDGQGDDAVPISLDDASLARLRDGSLRVRQRPGPKNALGLVKLIFPNVDDIYMHGTPAQTLFARSRRDFSHGCVRVEQPAILAEWALRDIPGWTSQHIAEAMNGQRPVDVRLPKPIRVILFYTTAAVMSADGTVHFAEDIYGRDPALDAALAKRRPS